MTLKPKLLSMMLGLCVIALTGCNEQVAAPDPAKLTRNAIGHYCNMIVADHPGPKAQVHEKGRDAPLWFSSVRDGLAYLALPGEAQKVSAIYVHDMGRATSWNEPQNTGIWIEASQAVYVIGSKKRGGMGALETIPFNNRTKAEAFARNHGGRIVDYADIPTTYILGDGADHAPATAHKTNHEAHGD